MAALDLRSRFDREHGDSVLLARCIYHRDDTPSMAIYADHVFCFGCQTYRWPDQFLADLGERQLVTRRVSRPRWVERQISAELVGRYQRWLWGQYADRVEWLQARGLRQDVLKANFIGHCGFAFTIPVGPEQATWRGIRFRRDPAFGEVGPKYWGTPGCNSVQLYRPFTIGPAPREEIVLCEGELDALRLAQEGYAAVSFTNGVNAMRLEHVRLFDRPVLVCYDQDDPGSRAATRVARLLGERCAGIVRWAPVLGKDVTEFLQRWPLANLDRRMAEAKTRWILFERRQLEARA